MKNVDCDECRRPTVKIPAADMQAILAIDAAVGKRDEVYNRPTVVMEAVRAPRS